MRDCISMFVHLLTSTPANLSETSPKDFDERCSVMRSSLDVVVFSEEDMVAVLYTAETEKQGKVITKGTKMVEPTNQITFEHIRIDSLISLYFDSQSLSPFFLRSIKAPNSWRINVRSN